ncbi:Asp/Glu racemase [Sedimentitalea sp. CY04]|uniref:Asp/Glu racemase n=1 Tax=Parasedimentitalea denitrificans TaxID=2211118 RepID=A0ABX0W4Y9_9RHOB|nr:aspartate/glutamate racemase family protein [Sedimentitalea sp. CY04]NIZ60686.1 Asp/Glu racemase [Sedimentitalea sp. CY04]
MKLDFETDKGIGTRATLGTIVLSTDETLEPEFAQMTALDGVALYHSRIPMVTEIRADTLQQMERDLPASARLLPSSLDFDVIGYGCTSAATVIGQAGVARAINSIFPQAKVTDPLTAIIAAANALGAKRLGFITPYIPDVSLRMRNKLEGAGFEIVAFGSFEESDDRVVARITPTSISAAIDQVTKNSDCDAVVAACTNLRCLGVINEVEQKTGTPVITSNQALSWHMLRLADITEPQRGFGKLFELPL